MKRISILLLATLFGVYAKGFSQMLSVKDNIRKELNEFLHMIGATENPSCDSINLYIYNRLSDKKIIDDSDLDEIGIYGFTTAGSHQNTYVLLKCFDEYEILRMTEGKYNESRDFSAILDDLQAYFDRHPEIDSRLLPFYNKEILNIYIDNTKIDELGYWFDWYKTESKKYGENK